MSNDAGDPAPRTVALSGSTGLIGSTLAASLRGDGHEVRPLVRGAARAGEIGWDPSSGKLDAAALEGVSAVVHLAGEPVGERWSEEKKKRIRSSRVGGTTLLARTIAAMARPPRVLVSASAVGYYGDRGDEILTEQSGRGNDFLAEVVSEWEAGVAAAEEAGIRTVRLRMGVVLSRSGGALARLLTPFQLGAGGRIGDGRQWMSWISLTDAVGVFRFVMDRSELRGVYNSVAPAPVTNAGFTRALGRVLGRPTFFPVPAAALRLAFGEMADATLLVSQRAEPTRLRDAGYTFQHATLEEALRAELAR
jgi:uncharacterized protein